MTVQARLFRQAQSVRKWYENARRKWTSSTTLLKPTTDSAMTEGHAKTPAMAQYLGYAGTLPFALGALASSVTNGHDGVVQATQMYGACIVSFLGGVHWGFTMQPGIPSTALSRGLAVSVIPSVVGWASALAAPINGLPVLAACFSALFAYERFVLTPAPPRWFRLLRPPLSIAAVGSLSVTWLAVRRTQEMSKLETREEVVVSS